MNIRFLLQTAAETSGFPLAWCWYGAFCALLSGGSLGISLIIPQAAPKRKHLFVYAQKSQAAQVKIGNEFPARCGGVLHETVSDAPQLHPAANGGVFLFGDRPVEGRDGGQAAHGRILRHQGKQHAAAGKVIGEPVHNAEGIIQAARQDQVPDQRSAEQPAVLQNAGAGLPDVYKRQLAGCSHI